MTVYLVTHVEKKEFRDVQVYEKYTSAKTALVRKWVHGGGDLYFSSSDQVIRKSRGRTVETWTITEQETK